MSNLIPAGRINKLFGTEGGLMLSLYAAFPRDFDLNTPLMVTIDALDVPVYCERFERRGISGAIAAFADFDNQRRASELVGREFRIESEEEESDEFFLEDLIGFAVSGHETAGPHFKGVISDYIDSEANPLFEAEITLLPARNEEAAGAKHAGTSLQTTVLIPAAEEFIAHIDFDARTIKFVLPEGLLDLSIS